MYKFFVIVLALAIIMTGCSAIPSTYLFNRKEYIAALTDAHSVIDADTALDEKDPTTELIPDNDKNESSEGAANKVVANAYEGAQIKKNLIPNHVLLNGLNEIRTEHDLPLLEHNQELERCAHIRAKEASYQFCHYRPDGTPCTSVSELADGEILVIGPWNSSLDDLLTSWMNSEPHRDSILKPLELEAGAGVYYNYEEQTVCWAVLFHIV